MSKIQHTTPQWAVVYLWLANQNEGHTALEKQKWRESVLLINEKCFDLHGAVGSIGRGDYMYQILFYGDYEQQKKLNMYDWK